MLQDVIDIRNSILNNIDKDMFQLHILLPVSGWRRSTSGIELVKTNASEGKATGHKTKPSVTKREKFRALAENRTNNALIAIGRIGNLSNRQLYEFDEVEVRKVIKALKDSVSEVEARFASPKGKGNARFKL